MRRLILPLTVSLLLAFPALAQDIARSGFTDSAGHRGIRASVVVAATPAEVWRALTTAEGWKRMGVGFAQVDFRVGGIVETSYQPTAKAGDAGNIKNQILAFSPERALAFRNVEAPPSFPDAAEFARTASMIELEGAGPGETRVTVTAMGFGPGPAFDRLLAFFGEGNAQTLQSLARSYARTP